MRKMIFGKAALVATILVSACYSNLVYAHNGHENDGNKQVCHTQTVSQTESGPVNYYTTYSNIAASNVTLQNFHLRTEDGQVVDVTTDAMAVNMQDLSAFSKGLVLHLEQVNFPGGADSIQVAEIELDVVSGAVAAGIVNKDNSTCTFSSVPKRISLYTAAPIALAHDAYHVKVDFTALNGVQLNLITTVSQNICCTQKGCGADKGGFGGWWDKWRGNGSASSSSESASGGSNCAPQGESASSTETKCKLVNRRYDIPAIPRAADDQF